MIFVILFVRLFTILCNHEVHYCGFYAIFVKTSWHLEYSSYEHGIKNENKVCRKEVLIIYTFELHTKRLLLAFVSIIDGFICTSCYFYIDTKLLLLKRITIQEGLANG